MLGERTGLVVTLVLGMFVLFLAAWGAAGFLEGWGLAGPALWIKAGTLLLIGVGPLAGLWSIQHPGAAEAIRTGDAAHEPAADGHDPTSTLLAETHCPHCGSDLSSRRTTAQSRQR
jgi:hypothetical protein